MNRIVIHSLAAAIFMGLVAAATLAAVPTRRLVDVIGRINLEQAIPKSFGDWYMDPRGGASVVDPVQAEKIKAIYSQVVTRIYINRKSGVAIMLSIAYGEDQRDDHQLHYPEVCYPAQGFQVLATSRGVLQLPSGNLPVHRLETVRNEQRFEPLTYWTTVGEHTVSGGFDKKKAEMRYNFQGVIPDGLLFRVSSINRNARQSFDWQDQFIAALVSELGPKDLPRIVGGK